jgi:flagellar hook-associated protein FlgK
VALAGREVSEVSSEEQISNEQKQILKTINELIDQFLEGKYDKFSLNFVEYLTLNDEEYWSLLGNFDSSGGAVNNLNGEYLIDTYSYDIEDYEKCIKLIKKIFITYHFDENNNYVIHSIEAFTIKHEVNPLLCE